VPAWTTATSPQQRANAIAENDLSIWSPVTTRETLAAAPLECERAAAFQKRIEIAIPIWQSMPTTKQIAR
jgi:hypothetical protein